jgi:hypothetical protein
MNIDIFLLFLEQTAVRYEEENSLKYREVRIFDLPVGNGYSRWIFEASSGEFVGVRSYGSPVNMDKYISYSQGVEYEHRVLD